MYITDIHVPTLRNAVFNVRLNAPSSSIETPSLSQGQSQLETSVETECHITYPHTLPLISSASIKIGSYTMETSGIKSSNMNLTSLSSAGVNVFVKRVDWGDADSYPLSAGSCDVLIGSDLVYEDRVLDVLVPTIHSMLRPGEWVIFV